jgi:Cu/Ag efflux protein CusF
MIGMRLWKVVVLVDLALLLGVGGGYLWWAREVRTLRQELEASRKAATEARQAAEQSWTLHGIVRTVLPTQRALFVTHESIPGLMTGMTMGFEAADPKLLQGLAPGDPIRFTLRRRGDQVRIVAIERQQG